MAPHYGFDQQVKYPYNFWDWFVCRKGFEDGIRYKGYYEFDKSEVIEDFSEWRKVKRRTDISSNIPPFCVDALSHTPHILKQNDLYLVPTGNRTCIIFDGSKYPYPHIRVYEVYRYAQDLQIRNRNRNKNILEAFRTQWNEQSFIKALHYCGAFGSLVKELTDVKHYDLGPSGQIKLRFPFWMKSKNAKLRAFNFEGMVDLDACVYPSGTDIVMPIEAKLEHFGDLAWHKLAFPCYRFIKQATALSIRTQRIGYNQRKIRIVPVYCALNSSLEAIIYVFSKIKIHKDKDHFEQMNGIILNDENQLYPKKAFKIDLNWIWR